MISDDPRRVALAEAMEAHDGARCHVERTDGGPLAANEGGDALSLALAYNALPAAAELIEKLTAKLRYAEGERDHHADHSLEQLDRAEKAEATIATQAAEIERLQNFRCACCDGPMYVPDACAECRDD